MLRALVFGTLAVLALFVSSPQASPPALEPAWQRILARQGVPPRPLGPRLEQAAAGATPLQVAALDRPEARAALAATLEAAGLTHEEHAELVPLVLEALREAVSPDGLWHEPKVVAGPLALGLDELEAVLGARAFRDRGAVAERLRALAPAATSRLSPDELRTLVAVLAEASDEASADALLARLAAVLQPAEERR